MPFTGRGVIPILNKYSISDVKLHIFNPEHEMALACDKTAMTLPHAIQEFKMNLGFLPALWAHDGDFVLVDDVLFALKALDKCHRPHADVLFVTIDDIKHLMFSHFEPWGWDKVVRQTLLNAGIPESLLPSDGYLSYIRSLADRRNTTCALSYLRSGIEEFTCGESCFCKSFAEVDYAMQRFGRIVVKTLWSSSGRGVRYIDHSIGASTRGWIANVIEKQGGLMVEPYYKKVKDFALEFRSKGGGSVEYCGLSIFETNKSSYAGNLVACEDEKMSMLCKYLPESLVETVKQRFIEYFSLMPFARYEGPLGVDMMVVAGGNAGRFLLHPCVEINVRRTMGHVANSQYSSPAEPPQLMHIIHDVNYKLKFDNIDCHFVKVL